MSDKIQIVIISGLVGAVVAYIGAILNDIVMTRSFVDKTLLNKRAELYKEAWKYTELLSNFCGKDDVFIKQYEKVSKDLHSWYFNIGGIYLSALSQRAFSNLQLALINVYNHDIAEEVVSEKTKEKIRGLGSLFRTRLTDDLLSRRSSRKL